MPSNFPITSRDTNNPFVRVKCFGKSEKTRTLKKIGTTDVAVWDEHIFIELNKMVVLPTRVDHEGSGRTVHTSFRRP